MPKVEPLANGEQRFWDFVQARQARWAMKNGLLPHEPHPVFDRVRFTNMYRRLDRGTLFQEWEIGLLADAREAFTQTVMYRAVNRIESWRETLEASTDWNRARFVGACRGRLARGARLFTGAYVSCRLLSGKGDSVEKLANLQEACMLVDADWLRGGSLKAGFTWLNEVLGRPKVGVGPFTAFQIALDLSYDRRFFVDDETWVHMGPGSKRGLKLLSLRPRLVDLLLLHERQPPVAHGFGQLTPADVEHALCEWQKYERAAAGGHAKGSYLRGPEDAWRPPVPVPPAWKESYNLMRKAAAR